jgi:hypothetical protein
MELTVAKHIESSVRRGSGGWRWVVRVARVNSGGTCAGSLLTGTYSCLGGSSSRNNGHYGLWYFEIIDQLVGE